jgi:fructose-bisphosphate aldolase, class I
MGTADLEFIARTIVADGRGILAADETPRTLTKRLAALGIESTPDIRRAYREMFFTAPGVAQHISGVILQDETIRQSSATRGPLVDLLAGQGIIPGIKVDTGATALAGCPGEHITDGLDGLRSRLEEYRAMGARFAKWRAVIAVSDVLPSMACVRANAHALARYAAICQEQGIVPIVEPEVLMDGSHTIERCEEVTGNVLQAVFGALFEQKVSLEGMLLKPNMVIPGKQSVTQATVSEVARATVRCLRRHAPAAVPGIVFLSGGQDHLAATAHLSAINHVEAPKPWTLSYSYGRALQDEALNAWHGRQENLAAAQQAFTHRAKCASAAVLGTYTTSMETEPAAASMGHGRPAGD